MDVTTALTLVLPEHLWEEIDTIRSKYDRAYGRWMPHINFIFPFISIENFNNVKDRLEKKLQDFDSFDLNLDTIDFFKQRKGVTFHIRPSDNSKLQDLFEIIKSELKEVEVKKEFHPHMTLAQFKKSELDEKKKELNEWFKDKFNNSISFKVDSIYLINRSRDNRDIPFKINKVIKLK